LKSIGGGLRARGPIPIRALVAAGAAALALAAPAAADTVTLDGSPLNVYADGLGALQVRYDNQASGLFYDPDQNPGHAGLEVLEGSQYYALQDGFDLEPGRTQVAAPVVSGSTIHSVYAVGPDIRVAEDIAYASGNAFLDVSYAFTNVSSAPISFRAGELADLYVGDNDSGNGVLAAGPPRFAGGRDPATGLVVGLQEQTPWLGFQEGDFGKVFDGFAGAGLNNTVDPTAPDNGVGADWQLDNLAPNATRTVTVRWLLAAPAPPGTVSPQTPVGPDGLPLPVAGKTVNLKLKAGVVRFKLPGRKHFVKLTNPKQVPLGTIIDTTHGRVTLTSAADLGTGTQHAWFYRGIFKVGQTKGSKPVTELSLAGPKPRCGPRGAHAAAIAKKRPKTRRLWGDGSGSFRTRGQFSSATVRGTRWVVVDECRGTLTKVTNGVVAVRDFRRHKTVLVRAGHSYLARSPK
jgi:hypothetical protein